MQRALAAERRVARLREALERIDVGQEPGLRNDGMEIIYVYKAADCQAIARAALQETRKLSGSAEADHERAKHWRACVPTASFADGQ